MTLNDGLQLYGVSITTLVILVTSIKYLISSRINPIEKDVESLQKEDTRLAEFHHEYSEELDELKQSLIDEVKDISQNNFDFRLNYEGAISEIKLLLAEKYVSKAELEKELAQIKERIEANTKAHYYEMKEVKNSIESINNIIN